MAQEITKWKTDDGKEFNTEVEALRHENLILAQKAHAWDREQEKHHTSSYGSSGGGGHD